MAHDLDRETAIDTSDAIVSLVSSLQEILESLRTRLHTRDTSTLPANADRLTVADHGGNRQEANESHDVPMHRDPVSDGDTVVQGRWSDHFPRSALTDRGHLRWRFLCLPWVRPRFML
jgi:hypothetical protein